MPIITLLQARKFFASLEQCLTDLYILNIVILRRATVLSGRQRCLCCRYSVLFSAPPLDTLIRVSKQYLFRIFLILITVLASIIDVLIIIIEQDNVISFYINRFKFNQRYVAEITQLFALLTSFGNRLPTYFFVPQNHLDVYDSLMFNFLNLHADVN